MEYNSPPHNPLLKILKLLDVLNDLKNELTYCSCGSTKPSFKFSSSVKIGDKITYPACPDCYMPRHMLKI